MRGATETWPLPVSPFYADVAPAQRANWPRISVIKSRALLRGGSAERNWPLALIHLPVARCLS